MRLHVTDATSYHLRHWPSDRVSLNNVVSTTSEHTIPTAVSSPVQSSHPQAQHSSSLAATFQHSSSAASSVLSPPETLKHASTAFANIRPACPGSSFRAISLTRSRNSSGAKGVAGTTVSRGCQRPISRRTQPSLRMTVSIGPWGL